MKYLLAFLLLFAAVAFSPYKEQPKYEGQKYILTQEDANTIIIALQTTNAIGAQASRVLVAKIQEQYNDTSLNPIKDTTEKK